MVKGLVYTVAGVAAFAWTALLAIALYALTFAFCYYKSPDCLAGSLARVAAIVVYFAGLAAGYLLLRWLSGVVGRRVRDRQDGLL